MTGVIFKAVVKSIISNMPQPTIESWPQLPWTLLLRRQTSPRQFFHGMFPALAKEPPCILEVERERLCYINLDPEVPGLKLAWRIIVIPISCRTRTPSARTGRSLNLPHGPGIRLANPILTSPFDALRASWPAHCMQMWAE